MGFLKSNLTEGEEGRRHFFDLISGLSLFCCGLLWVLLAFAYDEEIAISVGVLTILFAGGWAIARFWSPIVGYHVFLSGSITTYLGITLLTSIKFAAAPLLFPILALISLNLVRKWPMVSFYIAYSGASLCVLLYTLTLDFAETWDHILFEMVIALSFFLTFILIAIRLLRGWENSNIKIRANQKVLKTQKEQIEGQNEQLKTQNQQLQLAKEEMAGKNEELERYIESNQQLQNFAYVASHDLRAPLSAIMAMVEILGEAAEDRLDATERRYISLIRERGENMQQLMEALLEFSRVDSQQLKPQSVQPGELLDSVLQDLAVVIHEKKARVEVKGNLPEAMIADPIKLRQLFQNLISNGLKFSRQGVPPCVEIEAQSIGESWIYSFRDNGIGIPSDRIDRIFGMFERLHTEKEYKGTGIGLALVGKLVEQHHGKIWVESEVGTGSTFFVELPQEST